jgi:acyl-CoA synthetase (AMP-forming)/AMP-acid ligase II
MSSGGSGSDHLRWTYSQLRRGAALLASRLARLGLSKGRAIAIFSYSRAEWVLFYWAIVQLGCVFVPLNPRVISQTEEVRYTLNLVKPAVLVVAGEAMAKGIQESAPLNIQDIKAKILLSKTENAGFPEWISFPYLLASPVEKRTGPLPGRAFEDAVAIQFTSGTTSLPKACQQSSMNLCVAAMAMKQLRGLNSSHRLVQHLPPFSAMGVFFALTFWISGATVVYPSPTFDAESTLDAIEKQQCTHMMAVPTMIKVLSNNPSLSGRNLNSLLSIELGGAVTHLGILKMCIAPDKLVARRASVCYGMSESPGTLFVNDDDKQSESHQTVPVGTPIPGAKIKVCEPGSRTPISRGQTGELHLGGAQVINGYLDVESEIFYSDSCEEDERWIVTGDQAMVDETGAVHILGRYKDIIICGGENIAPATIERCLDSIEGVEVSSHARSLDGIILNGLLSHKSLVSQMMLPVRYQLLLSSWAKVSVLRRKCYKRMFFVIWGLRSPHRWYLISTKI